MAEPKREQLLDEQPSEEQTEEVAMEVEEESEEIRAARLLKEFNKLGKTLREEWAKFNGPSPSLVIITQIGNTLETAKLLMAQLDAFLPQDGSKVDMRLLGNIRNVLEIGAFYSLKKPSPDIDQFVRYTSQLKNYYFDYSRALRDLDSKNKYELYCARLLWLLTEDRVAEFHTELALALYPPDQVKHIQQNNPILFKTLKIAESLEDGRYDTLGRKTSFTKIEDKDLTPDQRLEKRGDDAIHDSFVCNYFLKRLIVSARPDIAETIELAYPRFSKKFAFERLQFKSVEELNEFAKQRKWVCNDGEYYTFETRNDIEQMPAGVLIGQALGYAKNLEQII